MKGKDLFFMVNVLIRTSLPVETLSRMFGVAKGTASTYLMAGTWLWAYFVKARFPTPSARRTKNRSPSWHEKHFHRRIQKIIDCLPIHVENATRRRVRRALHNK